MSTSHEKSEDFTNENSQISESIHDHDHHTTADCIERSLLVPPSKRSKKD